MGRQPEPRMTGMGVLGTSFHGGHTVLHRDHAERPGDVGLVRDLGDVRLDDSDVCDSAVLRSQKVDWCFWENSSNQAKI